MTSSQLVFLAAMAAAVAAIHLVRALAARTGSGLLAQRRFKRLHGAQVAALLAGSSDPDPRSPWIAITIDGRSARMVAARLTGEELQAGIELLSWQIPVQVWHTSGAADELEIPAGVDHGSVHALVAQLAALHVDSVAAPDLSGETTHVLRMRFRNVEQLPDQLDRVAPLLAELEQLAPD